MEFINYLLEEGYANTVKEAELIEKVASDDWYYSIAEAYDKKYNEVVRTIHHHVSSDSSNPANRTNLQKYLEKRRRVQRSGGEYYDSGKKSTRPAVEGSRKGLTPQERQKRRNEDENVDTRFKEKESGSYSVTKNPKKLKKQRAMGEIQEFVDYLIQNDYCTTINEATVIVDYASDEWFYSVLEARQPISRNARERIADIAADNYSYNHKGKERANKLINALSDHDKNRGKGELPVGRMARKIRTLQSRYRRGADKEEDYSRADEIENRLKS